MATQQSRQQRLAVLGGTCLPAKTDVRVNHALDSFKLVPVNISVVSIGDQRQPLISRFAVVTFAWFSVLVVDRAFRLPIGIRATIDRAGQDLVHRCVAWPLPVDLAARRARWKLE